LVQEMKIPKSDLKKMLKMMDEVPGWESIYIESKHASSDKNKKELLTLARKGGERPNQKMSSLGIALCSYTNKSHKSYSEAFTKEIKKLAPHWFENTADKKKEELLELARKGGERPTQRNHPLGVALSHYTIKLDKSYDEVFAKKIKKVAPYWFISRSDIANQKKKELLKLAKSSKKAEKRPNLKTALGSSFSHYTRKSSGSYDAFFTKRIKKIAPHWFENSADENKKELLKLARNGKRPIATTSLGSALCKYTSKLSGYCDAIFTKEIKKIAPHWFENSADENKKELLKLAEKGGERPNQKTNPCSKYLSAYTSKSNPCCDPTFTKQIKKLAPHWFKK